MAYIFPNKKLDKLKKYAHDEKQIDQRLLNAAVGNTQDYFDSQTKGKLGYLSSFIPGTKAYLARVAFVATINDIQDKIAHDRGQGKAKQHFEESKPPIITPNILPFELLPKLDRPKEWVTPQDEKGVIGKEVIIINKEIESGYAAFNEGSYGKALAHFNKANQFSQWLANKRLGFKKEFDAGIDKDIIILWDFNTDVYVQRCYAELNNRYPSDDLTLTWMDLICLQQNEIGLRHHHIKIQAQIEQSHGGGGDAVALASYAYTLEMEKQFGNAKLYPLNNPERMRTQYLYLQNALLREMEESIRKFVNRCLAHYPSYDEAGATFFLLKKSGAREPYDRNSYPIGKAGRGKIIQSDIFLTIEKDGTETWNADNIYRKILAGIKQLKTLAICFIIKDFASAKAKLEGIIGKYRDLVAKHQLHPLMKNQLLSQIDQFFCELSNTPITKEDTIRLFDDVLLAHLDVVDYHQNKVTDRLLHKTLSKGFKVLCESIRGLIHLNGNYVQASLIEFASKSRLFSKEYGYDPAPDSDKEHDRSKSFR